MGTKKLIRTKSHVYNTIEEAQDCLFAVTQFEFIKFAYIDLKEMRVVTYAEDSYNAEKLCKGQSFVEVME